MLVSLSNELRKDVFAVFILRHLRLFHQLPSEMTFEWALAGVYCKTLPSRTAVHPVLHHRVSLKASLRTPTLPTRTSKEGLRSKLDNSWTTPPLLSLPPSLSLSILAPQPFTWRSQLRDPVASHEEPVPGAFEPAPLSSSSEGANRASPVVTTSLLVLLIDPMRWCNCYRAPGGIARRSSKNHGERRVSGGQGRGTSSVLRYGGDRRVRALCLVIISTLSTFHFVGQSVSVCLAVRRSSCSSLPVM